jgi:hypothetical protein
VGHWKFRDPILWSVSPITRFAFKLFFIWSIESAVNMCLLFFWLLGVSKSMIFFLSEGWEYSSLTRVCREGGTRGVFISNGCRYWDSAV